MNKCQHVAIAERDGNDVRIEVSCLTHGETKPITFPASELEAFLSEGYFGVSIGMVPVDVFNTVIDALETAGFNTFGYRA